MKNVDEVQKYRDKQTLLLIESHKDIIAKTWKILDEDVLSLEIENAGKRKNATESLFLDKLSKRRKCLGEVESSLEKIEKLEKTLSDYNEKEAAKEGDQKDKKEASKTVMMHPSKRHSRT